LKPIILAKSSYDLDTLYRTAKQALGYNINTVNDSKNVVKDGQRVYHALSTFFSEDYKYSNKMSSPVIDFYHVVLGLVIEDDTYTELLHYRQLHLLANHECGSLKKNHTYCVVSGNLRGWRDAVIDGCIDTTSSELRQLMREVYVLFVEEGFVGLWTDYNKVPNNRDGTMIFVKT
jgi:hypothetical protein